MLAIGAHPDDIEIGAGGLLLGLAESRAAGPLRGADRHRGTSAGGARRGPFLPARRGPHHRAVRPARGPAARGLGPGQGDPRGAWRGRARPTSSSRRRPTTRTRTTGPSARSCPPSSATSSTWPTRSRSGTATSSRPSMYVPLSAETARRKVELLHKCFPSQRGRDWWDDEVFLGLARLRGMECRAPLRRGVQVRKVGDRARRRRARAPEIAPGQPPGPASHLASRARPRFTPEFPRPGRAVRPGQRTGRPAAGPCPRCAPRASSAPGPRCSPAS